MGYGIFGQTITGIRDIKTPCYGAFLLLGSISNVGLLSGAWYSLLSGDHWLNERMLTLGKPVPEIRASVTSNA